jgi:hypothetical protein
MKSLTTLDSLYSSYIEQRAAVDDKLRKCRHVQKMLLSFPVYEDIKLYLKQLYYSCWPLI